MNGFISSIFSTKGRGSNVIPPPLPTYPDFEVGFFKVVDNYVNGNLSANTGLSYDKNRRLIYSSITPNSSGKIFAFDEDYNFQFEINVPADQGHMYNHIDDTFTYWTPGTLRTYSYNGVLLKTQTGFYPFGEGAGQGLPGTLTYNYDDDEMAVTAEWGYGLAGDVVVYKRDGSGDWQFDRAMGITDAMEGITYDEDKKSYWYNKTSTIVRISMAGQVLQTIPQGPKTTGDTEGLAYNPNKKTLYSNADKGYHGGTPDGNRCVEYWPGFYE